MRARQRGTYETSIGAFPKIPKVSKATLDLRSQRLQRKIEVYDFTKGEKLSADQVRFYNKIMDHFAELITALLTSHLHLKSYVKYEKTSFLGYEVLIHSFVEPSAIIAFEIEREGFKGLLYMEFVLCQAIIDRLLGGKGCPLSEVSHLTEIEKVVYIRLIQRVMEAFSEAFKPIRQVNLKVESMKTSPLAIQIYPPKESMAVAELRGRVEDIPGDIKLVLPLAFLKPIVPKAKTVKASIPGDTNVSNIPIPVDFLQKRLETSLVPVIVEMGRTELTFGEVAALEVGNIIRFNTELSAPLKIRVGDKLKFLGRPGVKDRKISVQVSKIIQEGEEEYEE